MANICVTNVVNLPLKQDKSFLIVLRFQYLCGAGFNVTGFKFQISISNLMAFSVHEINNEQLKIYRFYYNCCTNRINTVQDWFVALFGYNHLGLHPFQPNWSY